MIGRQPYGLPMDEARDSDNHDSFFGGLDAGTARLTLLESPPAMSEPLTDEYIFANRA